MSHKVLVILAGAFLLLISIGKVAHAEKIGSPGDLFRGSKVETGILELGREAAAFPMTFSRPADGVFGGLAADLCAHPGCKVFPQFAFVAPGISFLKLKIGHPVRTIEAKSLLGTSWSSRSEKPVYEQPVREQNEESWVSREQNEESWVAREKNEESGASDEQPIAVSEPMTIVLLAVGLFGLALLERRLRSHGIRRTS